METFKHESYVNKFLRRPTDTMKNLFEFMYIGVNHSMPGNGGIDCYNFLSLRQRIFDTATYSVLLLIFIGPKVLRTIEHLRGLVVPSSVHPGSRAITTGRKVLLISLCLTFGVELGYKISSQQLIYLLNPCHLLTAVQVILII